MKTRAAVLNQVNAPLSIEELEIGEPKYGEVLVRMVASGVCHTDVSAMHGIIPTPLPTVLGHEGAGIVEAVGPGVTKLQKGDHVVTAAVSHCAKCGPCLSGEPYFCSTGLGLAIGGTMTDGTKRFRRGREEVGHFILQSSFAELTLVPEQIAVKVAKDLPLEQLGPLACGVLTGAGSVLNVAKVRPGETVAIFGCGGVGLSTLMAAKICRAKTIIAVDRNESRLAMAKELGADETIDAKAADAVAEVQKLTGGGADYAFECVGNAEVIRQAFDAVRVGGTLVVSGAAAGSEAKLDALGLILKNVKANMVGGAIPDVFVPRLIDFWRKGELPFDRLLGTPHAHADIAKAIAGMESGEVIKPMIVYA